METIIKIFTVVFLPSIIFLMFIAIFSNEEQIDATYKKIKCFIGLHKIKNKFKDTMVNKYYCEYCKKPRNHPKLKIVNGDDK